MEIQDMNNMKGLGIKMRCQGMECINMQMEQCIKGNGRTTNIMEKDSINSQMAHAMKETGKAI